MLHNIRIYYACRHTKFENNEFTNTCLVFICKHMFVSYCHGIFCKIKKWPKKSEQHKFGC